MGFASWDKFLENATVNGKTWRQDFVKTISNPSVVI
jgi:hypothetical protein